MRLSRSLPFLFAFAALSAPSIASADVSLSITLAPPPLPIYQQPVLPAAGYIWTPGYWAYGPEGYYWVPGTWVLPPAADLLWTPGYWGWRDGIYVWNAGYWGPQVGYYGGIDYGFGYTGNGYAGGRWDHGHFRYNRAVNHISGGNVAVYNQPVHVAHASRVSFNGGKGGTRAHATSAQLAAAQGRHEGLTAQQTQHEHAAAGNHALLASVNHNRPPITATSKPGEINGTGAAREPQASHESARQHATAHPETAPATDRAAHREVTPTERAAQQARRPKGAASRPANEHAAVHPETAPARPAAAAPANRAEPRQAVRHEAEPAHPPVQREAHREAAPAHIAAPRRAAAAPEAKVHPAAPPAAHAEAAPHAAAPPPHPAAAAPAAKAPAAPAAKAAEQKDHP